MNISYIIESVAAFSDISIFYFQEDGKNETIRENHPLCFDKRLRDMLIEKSRNQDIPVLVREEDDILFFAFRLEEGYVLGGPVSLIHLDVVQKRKFYRSHGLKQGEYLDIPFMEIAKLLALLKLLSLVLTGRETDIGELVFKNGLVYQDYSRMEQEQAHDKAGNLGKEQFHHAYQDERMLAHYIQTGNLEKLYDVNNYLMASAGRIAQTDVMQSYNMAIVAITLSARAAIEGGVSPAAAYEISDFYIRRLSVKDSVMQIQNIVNNALSDFAKESIKLKQRGYSSGYVEQIRDYVAKHVKEEIRIADMAGMLGISRTHLSRLFKEEMGMTLQEYIIKSRIEIGANLLKYSREPIRVIAEVAHFSSQSRFTEQFQKYMGMTPKEYRERYKPKEF